MFKIQPYNFIRVPSVHRVFELKISKFLNYFKMVLQRQVGRVYELSYRIVLAKIGSLVASLFLENNATLAVILLATTFEGIKLELIVNNICILYSY